MSRSWLWGGLAALALAIVVLAVALSDRPDGGGSGGEPAPAGTVEIAREPGPPLAAGEAVPEWSAPALDGSGTMTWSSYEGEPTVLAIWAPWCPHCQAELPLLSAGVEAHPGVQLVTISTAVDQGTQGSQDYLTSRGLSFPVAVDDEAGTLRAGLGVTAYPTTYFVNAQGDVIDVTTGEIPEDRLDELLTALEGG